MGGVSHHCTIPYILDEVERILATKPKITMLDVGFGQGNHAKLIRNKYQRDQIHLIGIEAFPDYIGKEFKQCHNFDVIYIGDAKEIVDTIPYHFDLTLCADVIEHQEREEGMVLLHDLKCISENILVTLPICDYPQDAVDGNEYEIHRTQWKEHEMNKLGFETVKIVSLGEIGHGSEAEKDVGFMGIFRWSKSR